jgi:hypothetical protein
MSEHLFRIGPTAQRRLILSGLGGVGKTQITISFLLKFLPRSVYALAPLFNIDVFPFKVSTCSIYRRQLRAKHRESHRHEGQFVGLNVFQNDRT